MTFWLKKQPVQQKHKRHNIMCNETFYRKSEQPVAGTVMNNFPISIMVDQKGAENRRERHSFEIQKLLGQNIFSGKTFN